jgi:succinylarginine dihydrolase
MANGGGPACLRLRVVADPARVDPRFIADEAKLDAIAEVVTAYWHETIAPDQIGDANLLDKVRLARLALLEATDLVSLA